MVEGDNKETEGMHGGLREALPTWKRLLDLVVLTVTLPLTLPLALLIAACIKLKSPGPVIFRQERIGFHGRPFLLLKFRTMQVSADTAGHQAYLRQLQDSDAPMTKLDERGDARVIPCGRLLRASGLDELPQLLNVWRGEMSLVGPRPCLPYEYDGYTAHQKHRFDALPGLTGLWQVSGKNRTTFHQMIQLDIHYSRHKSLWLDLGIIVRTPWVLVSQVLTSRLAPRDSVLRPLEKVNP